jgi:hypothetical protein
MKMARTLGASLDVDAALYPAFVPHDADRLIDDGHQPARSQPRPSPPANHDWKVRTRPGRAAETALDVIENEVNSKCQGSDDQPPVRQMKRGAIVAMLTLEDAHQTAVTSFGPSGMLAPRFLLPEFPSAQPRPYGIPGRGYSPAEGSWAAFLRGGRHAFDAAAFTS